MPQDKRGTLTLPEAKKAFEEAFPPTTSKDAIVIGSAVLVAASCVHMGLEAIRAELETQMQQSRRRWTGFGPR